MVRTIVPMPWKKIAQQNKLTIVVMVPMAIVVDVTGAYRPFS